MAGIPHVLETDAEDVAWALQTAEALWKRNERVDAIVWLRRAAQAAGEAEDDDRALALARDAAELAEWIAHNPPGEPSRSAPPARPPSNAPTAAEAVDDLLRVSHPDVPVEVAAPAPEPDPAPPSVIEPAPETDRASVVPTAAEKHAGMLDPWAEHEAPTRGREDVDAPRRNVVVPSASAFDPEEVVTSAPPMVRAEPARKPPPLPAARPAPRPPSPPPPPPAPPPPAPPPPPRPSPPPAPPPVAAPPPLPAPPPAPARAAGSGSLDLSGVDALADLPDDARDAFAAAAQVQSLARDEEASGFALALVLEGSVDLAATIVDAPARRLDAGSVLRTRGTIDHVAPVRLIGASDAARIATWDESAVAQAFRTCPWVEDDLRAAGDRLQAEVGATMGPLGERLDPSMRAELVGRLALRVLGEHEVFAERGKPIPGLLVVGAGELELLDEGDAPVGKNLRAGDFLFPMEVLQGAPAPAGARAAGGGALVLVAARPVAQELLITSPPLLEIFVGA